MILPHTPHFKLIVPRKDSVLIQNSTPIYLASRAISITEANYQNLEWETLATIWGMEEIHYFLYGNEFTLETDQKPFISIYWKHLIDVSPRIQRLIVQALPYSFHIVYAPGKQIPIANALLRNLKTSEDKEENQISLPILAVNYVTGNYQQYPEKCIINRIREETSKDTVLQLLAKYIHNGRPGDQKKIPKELHLYWNYRDEISMEDGILLKSHGILIPYTLHMEMLDLMHEGHQGIEKCLLHSRESLFWPGITDEIHQTVNKCLICQFTSTAERKLPSEIPPHAWHTLGTDLFYWKHSDYLVPGDYYSKNLIVRKLQSSTGSAVCKEIRNIVSELGKPYIIGSDNRPCHTSIEFKELMKHLQIQHITSSMHFPQSNGFAEVMVKIAKKLMDCSTLQEKHWDVGLLEYRCTPLTANIPSLLELLTGCKPQMNLSSMSQDISINREYCEAIIQKQPFQLMNQDKEYGASILLTEYGNLP